MCSRNEDDEIWDLLDLLAFRLAVEKDLDHTK